MFVTFNWMKWGITIFESMYHTWANLHNIQNPRLVTFLEFKFGSGCHFSTAMLLHRYSQPVTWLLFPMFSASFLQGKSLGKLGGNHSCSHCFVLFFVHLSKLSLCLEKQFISEIMNHKLSSRISCLFIGHSIAFAN